MTVGKGIPGCKLGSLPHSTTMHGLSSLTAKTMSANSCLKGGTKQRTIAFPCFINPRCVEVIPFFLR